MKVYKRPNSPYYWYEFTINGTRTRKPTKRKNKTDAERVLAEEYAKAMNVRQFGEKPSITLRDAMQRAVDSVQGKTRTSYLLSMRKWLGMDLFDKPDHWALDGDMLLENLTQGDLEDHVMNRTRDGLKVNSINLEIRMLQRAHNLCAKRFKVNHELEFKKARGFVKTRFLTPAEEDAILVKLSVDSPAYAKARDLFVFLIDTGCRVNEVLEASWADLNLPAASFEVYRSKTHSVSKVPLSDRLVENLRRRHNNPAPFENMSRAVRVLRRTIDEVCNGNDKVNAQRGKATIHSLRDTYITRMEAKGMSLRKIGKLVGHNSIDTTKKYAHLDAADVVDEARKLING